MHVCAQSCQTHCFFMWSSPPGSSGHRIFQARILEWVAISFSRGSSWPRDQTRVSSISYIAGGFFFFLPLSHLGSPGLQAQKWTESAFKERPLLTETENEPKDDFPGEIFAGYSFIQHWRRKWQPTPVFLPGEPHGQRSLAGCSPWCHKGLGTTEAT